MHKTQQHHVVRSLGWHPPQNVSRRIHPLFFCFSVFLVQLMARDENLVGDLDEFSILKGRRRRRWADWLFYYKKGWATGFMSGLAECSYCVLCSSYLVRGRLDKHLHRDGRTDGRRRRMWKCRDADWHSRSVRVVMETVDFHQCEMRGEMNRANDISLFWWLGAITNHRLFTHCPTKHEGWFKKKTASNNNKRKTWKEKQDWWWPSLDLDPFGRVPHRKEDSQVSAHCDGRRPVWKSGIRPSNFQTTSVSVSVWQ